jgi:hypothetical protein
MPDLSQFDRAQVDPPPFSFLALLIFAIGLVLAAGVLLRPPSPRQVLSG